MLLLFLGGFVVGVVLSLGLLFVAFFYPQVMLDNIIRRKTIKHTELKAVAREAAKLPPVKVESLVTIARFDGDVTGEATRCRVVLYGNTVHVYRIDELERLPDQRQVVKKEVLLGKINASCIDATGEHISKYHRHRNKNSRFSSIKGKCLILRAHDGMPLFVEDPAVRQRKLLARIKRDQARRALATTMEQLVEAGATEEVMRLLEDEQQHQTYTDSPTASQAESRQAGSAFFINALDVGRARAAAAAEAPVSEWRCVAMKFPTRRIHERWLTLLQRNEQSLQWWDFVRHLPQIDVLNLLIARLFYENLRTSSFQELIERKIQEKLFKVSRSLPPHIRGTITLERLTLGGEIPLVNHVSEAAVSPEGDLEFDFDVLYRGGLVLSLRFAITYRRIRLPDMIFHIKVLELSGRMRFNIAPPPTTKFWLSGPKPPQLRLEFTQEMASPEGLLSVIMGMIPDLSAIATNTVKVMLFEDMVLPNFDDFPWPVLAGLSSDEDNKAKKAGLPRRDEDNVAPSFDPGSPHSRPWMTNATSWYNATPVNAPSNLYGGVADDAAMYATAGTALDEAAMAAAETAAEGFVPLSSSDQATLLHGGRKTWTVTTQDLFPTYPHTSTRAVGQAEGGGWSTADTMNSYSTREGRQSTLHFLSGAEGQTPRQTSYSSSGFGALLRRAGLRSGRSSAKSASGLHAREVEPATRSVPPDAESTSSPSHGGATSQGVTSSDGARLRVMARDVQ